MKEVLLEHAFTIVENVYFDIGKENFRSRKAVEKLGAVDQRRLYVLSKDVFLHRGWGVCRADQN